MKLATSENYLTRKKATAMDKNWQPVKNYLTRKGYCQEMKLAAGEKFLLEKGHCHG